MDLLDKDLYSLKSPQLRKIIKLFRIRTNTRVPPFSRSRKIELIDNVRKFDMIRVLTDLNNTNLINDKLSIKSDNIITSDIIIDSAGKHFNGLRMPKLVRQESGVPLPTINSPQVVEEEKVFEEDEKKEIEEPPQITKNEIMASIEDLRFDIDYLTTYQKNSDELKELKKQLVLYNKFLETL